jgi:hypothetical protein
MYYSASMDPAADLPAQFVSLSQNWLPVAVDLYQGLQQFAKHLFRDGPYEILEYDSVLELLDPRGELAIFKKRLRVKFLQDNITTFQDYAWGNGRVLLEYHCSPGIMADRYLEGGRWNVLISLRDSKGSGDVEEFYIERRLQHNFASGQAWWQISPQHTTRWAKVSIIFPSDRRCQRAVLIEPNPNHTTFLTDQHFADLPGGRQVLTWGSHDVKRYETYTLQWRW